MVFRCFVRLPVWVSIALWLICAGVSYAQEPVDSSEVETSVTETSSADTSVAEKYVAEESSFSWSRVLFWPFNNIVQPLLNALIYPVAKPVDYAFQNGIIEKTIDLITFGKKRNIFFYPGFNLKPGSQTMLGLNYRHRGFLMDKDY